MEQKRAVFQPRNRGRKNIGKLILATLIASLCTLTLDTYLVQKTKRQFLPFLSGESMSSYHTAETAAVTADMGSSATTGRKENENDRTMEAFEERRNVSVNAPSTRLSSSKEGPERTTIRSPPSTTRTPTVVSSSRQLIHFPSQNLSSFKKESHNELLSTGNSITITSDDHDHDNDSLRKEAAPVTTANTMQPQASTVSRPPLTPKKRHIRVLTKRYILACGPALHSLRLWLRYVRALIYKKGVPLVANAVHYTSKDGSEYVHEGYPFKIPDVAYWDTNEAHWSREGRFPSVEERIKFYMGKWYDAEPTPEIFGEDFRHRTAEIVNLEDNHGLEGVFQGPLLNPFRMSPQALFDFSSDRSFEGDAKRNLVECYTRDIIDMAILRGNSTTPVLIRMGDGASQISDVFNYSYPVFGKVRDIIAQNNSQNHWRHEPLPDCKQCGVMHESIIWPLNRGRHFKYASYVPKSDVHFTYKKSVLIWRGGSFSAKEESLRDTLPIEKSSFKQRLALVKNYSNSSRIDAKFTGEPDDIPAEYMGDSLGMTQMLKYKYIMSIEGNDVSSGLKWMLFSNSVVFLPPITYASWTMEAIMEPWVHYIPVKADMSDVEEMVIWAEANVKKTKMISERSTLFAYDLLFHPDAFRDEELILSGIMKRYQDKFGARR